MRRSTLPIAIVLVFALLLGCAAASETAATEAAGETIDAPVFDERLAPLEDFLNLPGVYLVQIHAVMAFPTARTNDQYRVRVRVDGRPATLHVLAYDSVQRAAADARALPGVHARIPARGGAGIQRRPPVFITGQLVVVAAGVRGSSVERRLQEVFGRALPG